MIVNDYRFCFTKASKHDNGHPLRGLSSLWKQLFAVISFDYFSMLTMENKQVASKAPFVFRANIASRTIIFCVWQKSYQKAE